jgi:8-oxo-dGTP diphosphatase
MRYNVTWVIDKDFKNVLMVKRTADPYKGLKNCPGGKKEHNESISDGAMRELYEETGIRNVWLHYVYTFKYLTDLTQWTIVDCFFTMLKESPMLIQEKHPLEWVSLDSDFWSDEFAGDGNIYHLKRMVEIHKEYRTAYADYIDSTLDLKGERKCQELSEPKKK